MGPSFGRIRDHFGSENPYKGVEGGKPGLRGPYFSPGSGSPVYYPPKKP